MRCVQKRLKVLVAFNESEIDSDAEDPDSISEAAVHSEVEAVAASLGRLGHTFTTLPIVNPIDQLAEIRDFAPDVIFNLCEGLMGNSRLEMHASCVWELLGIPYTGNGPLTQELSRKKSLAKKILEADGVSTPGHILYDAVPESCAIAFPVIVKPSEEDASLGVGVDAIARDMGALQKLVKRILDKYHQPALVEAYIEGREINAAVLGGSTPKVLPFSEIDFSGLDACYPRITSYEAKWLVDHPMYHKTPSVCPAKVDPELAGRLEKAALRVYKTFEGRDYGRVDFRVDAEGTPYVLEFNPNPDISPEGGFAKALRAAEIDFDQFVDGVLHEAHGRRVE